MAGKAIVLIIARDPDTILATARQLGFDAGNIKITTRSLHKGHNTLYMAIPAEARNATGLKPRETVYVAYTVVEKS